MEIADYRQSISQPIKGDSPVGERLSDDPLFDFVEDQMMKVGSLSHASVQWPEVEQTTVILLSEKSKDLKLLLILLQCLHNKVTPSRFVVSLQLLTDFMFLYWEECFPAPGPKGRVARGKFFSQIVQRFTLVIDKLDFDQFTKQERNTLKEALESWHLSVKNADLMSDSVTSLATKITSALTRTVERERIEQTAPEKEVSAPIASSQKAVSMDSSSDKATKQSLLKVADVLSEQEFGIALAIRVRRYAVWSSIASLPEHDANGETQLRGMMQERVKEYHDQLRAPDLELWRKVEQSLTMAPFWFEGQLMSYDIAKSLGQSAWCDAILSESAQFVSRMPDLLSLKFKGGEPFVSDKVKEWLLSHQNVSGQQATVGNWEEKEQEAMTLAKDAGIAVALSMLNDGLIAAREPRDKFYWRLLSTNLLNANNLDAMAKEQYQTLYSQVATMSVNEWEPSLVEQLQKHTTSE
ncbi:type VI secretion system protein TssA [Vibrio scophthalmi]|uniref:type VI secretion system protein TssA n=1 Tax=Vibrio scophthalmi TaxID=45658 RepID=UPI0022839F2D|nr:type VI secretion system protein TssA [Vibrio scophthalmi]MCY9803277.1 type VI secretion system protein TssA [Vibrio scophthalmi]